MLSRPRHRATLALLVTLTVAAVVPAAGPSVGAPLAQSPPTSDPASPPTTAPIPGEGNDALRHEYEEIAGRHAELLIAYDRTTRRLTQLLIDQSRARDKVVAVDALLVRARRTLARSEATERDAKEEVARAAKRVRAAEDELRDHAVEAYISGGTLEASILWAILDNDDSSSDRISYTDAVTERQEEIIDDLQQARRDRDEAKRRASSVRRRATRDRDDVADLRADARSALTRAEDLTRGISHQRTLQGRAVAALAGRKIEIESRVIALSKASDGLAMILATLQSIQPDWVPGSIEFASPAAPGVRVSSPFGMRSHPILATTRLHSGADLHVDMGGPVRAAADGRVVLAEARGGYGNTVVIDHGHTVATVYAHNSSFTVAPDQLVKRGDVIARGGSTGLSTGPHIHFETRVRGVPVNPVNFVQFP